MIKSLNPIWDFLSYSEQFALWNIMKDWVIEKERVAEIYITYERNLDATERVVMREALWRVNTRKE